jgi:hypothetical protein
VRIVAHGPGLAVEDQQRLTVLQAVVFLLPVHVLKTVYAAVVDYALLVPKAFGNWRILVVDVFEHEFALLAGV